MPTRRITRTSQTLELVRAEALRKFAEQLRDKRVLQITPQDLLDEADRIEHSAMEARIIPGEY